MAFTSISNANLRSNSQLLFNMLLMRSYIFCASVRLAVIVISICALLKTIMLMFVFTTKGLGFIFTLINKFDDNLCYRASYYLVRDAIYFLEQYPEIATSFLQLYSVLHGISCVIAAYGAYKLKRYFVLPLAFFEFIFIVEIFTVNILFLRIIRHFVSLEMLIGLTVVAAAYATLVVYDFCALVAFEQIMGLVRSKRYQQFYGSDPLNPVLNANTVKLQNATNFVSKTNKYTHKWWQLNRIQNIPNDENMTNEEVDVQKYFQNQEILSDVLLHNGITKF